MDVTARFQSLLEAAFLTDPTALATALDIPVEAAIVYANLRAKPPAWLVLAVERLIDVRLAEEICACLPGRRAARPDHDQDGR